jgi:ATP-dependent Clp protease ATP-binding subunit ClpA
MKILCDALELRCPRHRDIVPSISSTVLWCRAGLRKQQPTSSSSSSTITWLLFRGRDAGGKTAIALELAKLVFGSYAEFIALDADNSDKPTCGGKLTLKRQRSPGDENDGCAAGPRLLEAIQENPHRVILIDGVDRLDRDLEMRIKDAIAGKVRGCNGDLAGLDDAIVVLCSDVLDSGSMLSSSKVKPRIKRSVQDREEGNAMDKEVRSRPRLRLDLNVCIEDGEEEEDLAILDVVDGVFLFN